MDMFVHAHGQGKLDARFALLLGIALLALPVRSLAAEPKVVRGVVVDTDGRPVAGAEVFCGMGGIPWWEQRWESSAVRSDSDGRFRVSVPVDPHSPFVSWVKSVWAFQPGRRAAFMRMECGMNCPDDPEGPVRLVMGAPTGFHVRVLDASGKVVPGAKVAVSNLTRRRKEPAILLLEGKEDGETAENWYDAFHTPRALLERWGTTTDEQGIAAIPNVDFREAAAITVVSPQSGQQICWLPAKPGCRSTERTVRLRPTGRVRFQAVTVHGEVVSGVRVRLIAHEEARSELNAAKHDGVSIVFAAPVAVAEGTSDAQGCFEAPAVAEGDVSVVVIPPSRPTYLPCPTQESVLAECRAGKTSTIKVLFKPAVRVHGVVRMQATGKPVRDVWLQPNVIEGRPVRTDAEGKCELYHVSGVANLILSNPEHLAFSDCDAKLLRASRHVVIPDDVKDLELTPIELMKISGRVLNVKGKPIPEAAATSASCTYVEPTIDEGAIGLRSCGPSSIDYPVKADGSYSFWVPADSTCRLTFGANDYASGSTTDVDIPKIHNATMPDLVLCHPETGWLRRVFRDLGFFSE
jgi:hypothetical protein